MQIGNGKQGQRSSKLSGTPLQQTVPTSDDDFNFGHHIWTFPFSFLISLDESEFTLDNVIARFANAHVPTFQTLLTMLWLSALTPHDAPALLSCGAVPIVLTETLLLSQLLVLSDPTCQYCLGPDPRSE